MSDFSKFTASVLPDMIYAWHKITADDSFRVHLGCSQLGAPCERSIWYAFRWAYKEDIEGRIYRLFETGNLEEERIVRELEGIGIAVSDRQSFVNLAPHISGAIDGIGVGFPESTQPHLLEFKTSGGKGFADMVRNGVEKSKPQHYCQMQLYMGGKNLERAYYIVVNKDTDEIYAERIKFSKVSFDTLVTRGKSIVAAKIPPDGVSANPTWYQCRFCSASKVCHGSRPVPEVNCRTCCHSTPEDTGKWSCAKFNNSISTDEQKQACDYHVFIPKLLKQEPVDAGDDWVSYGSWVNGIHHTKSKDYRLHERA